MLKNHSTNSRNSRCDLTIRKFIKFTHQKQKLLVQLDDVDGARRPALNCMSGMVGAKMIVRKITRSMRVNLNAFGLVPLSPSPAILKCHAPGALPSNTTYPSSVKRGTPAPRWGVAVHVNGGGPLKLKSGRVGGISEHRVAIWRVFGASHLCERMGA